MNERTVLAALCVLASWLTLSAGSAAAADQLATPSSTCTLFVHTINACDPSAQYKDDGVAGCTAELSTMSPVCQHRAHALSVCEASLTCEQFLALHPKECADQEKAFEADCGERAWSPRVVEGAHGPGHDQPSFHSLGFHVRSQRRFLASQRK